MVIRSLWRAKSKLLWVTTGAAAGAGAAMIATSDDPASALKLAKTVPSRLLRDSFAAAAIAFGTLSTVSSFIAGKIFNG